MAVRHSSSQQHLEDGEREMPQIFTQLEDINEIFGDNRRPSRRGGQDRRHSNPGGVGRRRSGGDGDLTPPVRHLPATVNTQVLLLLAGLTSSSVATDEGCCDDHCPLPIPTLEAEEGLHGDQHQDLKDDLHHDQFKDQDFFTFTSANFLPEDEEIENLKSEHIYTETDDDDSDDEDDDDNDGDGDSDSTTSAAAPPVLAPSQLPPPASTLSRRPTDAPPSTSCARYQFSYAVSHYQNQYGHQETRDGGHVSGVYHVLLPGGTRQVVRYYADDTGYHPTITYEDAYNIDPRSVTNPPPPPPSLSTTTRLALPLTNTPSSNTRPDRHYTKLPGLNSQDRQYITTESTAAQVYSSVSALYTVRLEENVFSKYSPYSHYLSTSSDFSHSLDTSVRNNSGISRSSSGFSRPSTAVRPDSQSPSGRTPSFFQRGLLVTPLRHITAESTPTRYFIPSQNVIHSGNNNIAGRRNFPLVPLRQVSQVHAEPRTTTVSVRLLVGASGEDLG
ncbi:Pro-resilin-like 118 [Homarus americanus]|uniref:Pro-resilin-like 118 n=1 Tax=Homarus americanus TaxID=6706 RepID=A0A8J5TCA5_HOMAM|nr:Pro-resilin-like 118 [Homarus americanus]